MKFRVLSIICILCLLTMFYNISAIESNGNFCYVGGANERSYIDSLDLAKLETNMVTLIDNYNKGIITALKTIGQTVSSDSDYDKLVEHIVHSQDIKTNNKVTIEGNLSQNCAAWVNGKYIVGTGQDVSEAYNSGYTQGYTDGTKQQQTQNVEIEYVYHKHGDGYCNQIPVYHVHSGTANWGETRTAAQKLATGCYVGGTEIISRYRHRNCSCGLPDGYCAYGNGKTEYAVNSYGCGKSTSSIDGYKCGLTEGMTVVEAKLIYY